MQSPLSRAAWLRIVPFILFMLLLVLRGGLDGHAYVDARWLYALNVLLVSSLLWVFRREYGEFARINAPSGGEVGLAVLVGVVVFAVWINLDAPIFRIGEASATFTPLDAQGGLDWPLITARWVGATLMVPVMEELFWRSFLMRWIDRAQFETLVPQQVSTKAMVLSTFVFMLAHTLWLAAIVAGLAYAWLFVRTGKLWVPVIAHAVTNGVLGIWVVATRQWGFW